jgi:hypothetical protein
MAGLAIVVLIVGLADAAGGGLTAEPGRGPRLALGLAAAALAGMALAWGLLGLPVGEAAPAVALATAGAAGWMVLRRPGAARPRAALAVLGTTILAFVVAAPLLEAPGDAALARYLATWEATPPPDAARLALGVVVAFALAATANGVVRAVLLAADPALPPSEERLRGGRWIGVLERWLLFALALAGEPTAAALVVSAKSLVRFPELSSAAQQAAAAPAPDLASEYFLLGSLTSWSLALLAALPLLVG